MIVIIDYGMGNLRSVQNALNALGFKSVISSDPQVIKEADQLILPGVGAFEIGMKHLRERGLIHLLKEEVLQHKKPILGICLGAQLLAKKSYEMGEHDGLGFINAEVIRIKPSDPKLKIPHVGWNDVTVLKKEPLFVDLPSRPNFYFVHSFFITCDPEIITSRFEYGGDFTASIQQDNIYGTQFHPEKSQLMGLRVLKNFVGATCSKKD